MGKGAGLLQVTVREVSPWVVEGDDVCLDVRRESGSPESRRVPRSEENAPHAWLGSVDRADHRWIVRHHLRKPGQSDGYVPGQGLEVSEVIPQETVDLDMVLVRVGQSQLQGTKEARRAQHHQSHELELSQHTLPLLHTDPVPASEILEYVDDPLCAPLR